MKANLDNLSATLNEWGYTAEEWASFSSAKQWRIKNPDKLREQKRRYRMCERERERASGFARPYWLRAADFKRIKRMDEEDAVAELNRLKEEFSEKRREAYRSDPDRVMKNHKNWLQRNKKLSRAGDKKKWLAIKSDPERHARYLAKSREQARKHPWRVKDAEKERERARRKYQRMKVQKLAQTDPQALRKMINPMLPGYFIASARMDVTAQVTTWALERKIPFDDLSTWVKKAVTEYNRQFDHFKNVSIDAPIAGTENLTRADLIDSEAFHF